MTPFHLESRTISVATISRCDRWQAYQRLQELDVPCHCAASGGLEVEVYSVLTILQLRSVVRQLTSSRQELIDWLEHCWQSPDWHR